MVRADVVHDKLLAQGFEGSERTSRRAVAEPGTWLQFDWGQGPRIGGREALLWCAWSAWSRFRVVLPTWDRTLPTVVACLERPSAGSAAARPMTKPASPEEAAFLGLGPGAER
jgi:hypothetical protein